MKMVLAAALVVLTGGISSAVLVSGLGERQTEKETSAFVNDTVNELSDGWHPQTLTDRAEPGLIQAMTGQGQTIGDLFRIYRKLGALTEDPQCTLKNVSQFQGREKSYVTASYGCEAQYENGPASLQVTVRKPKGEEGWKIYYLNISSPYFAELHYRGKQ